MLRILILLFCFSFGLAARGASDGSGLQISAAVDLSGSFKGKRDSKAADRLDAREAELILTAPIDHLFTGTFSLAAHREAGESFFEVHEAYIATAKLIPRSTLRLGQFFLGVGRLNRFHRHEWPFVVAPPVHRLFFGSEGAIDSGIEYSYLAPLPFYLSTTVGVTNGYTYGHSHDEGERPRQPTHYLRSATSFELPGAGVAEWAFNYLSRTDSTGQRMSLVGSDFTGKWRAAGVLNLLLQSELWQRRTKPENGPEERSLGAYVLPQVALSSQWQLAPLLDYYTVQSLRSIGGGQVKNAVFGLTPTLTYRPSEFSSFRLAYEMRRDELAGRATREDRQWQIQGTFILGAHPAHDF